MLALIRPHISPLCLLLALAGLFFSPISVSRVHAIPAVQCGKASWYALTSMTASGQRADPSKMTAAHRTLPFGSRVHVTNLRNGKTVSVTINDRGPFVTGRVIDVTKAAAIELGFLKRGVTQVAVTLVSPNGQTRQGGASTCGN
ncbi:septal ring lytic transglycosylase RlpA family protein [Roseibium sp.]|uniref:septal ring lytic transglycosylase RlpA family protein n=1 Tax=Roseibium sp. TaxID=1936156 RepID=UPI003A97561F